MSPHELLLHIGAPKAGSSTLQAFFSRNREELLGHGYYYPEHELGASLVSGGHAVFANAIRSGDLASAKAWLDSAFLTARRHRAKLLISAEALYGNLAKLRPLLDSEHSTLVIGYFRHPIELVVSDYAQRVKRAGLSTSVDRFCDDIKHGSRRAFYDGKPLFAWQAAVGRSNLRIRPFDPSTFSNGSIEHDVLDLLEIENRKGFVFLERTVNASYAPSVLALKRLMNEMMLVEHDRRLDEQLQSFSDRSPEPRPTALDILGEEKFAALRERFQEPVAKLENEVLETSSPNWGSPEKGRQPAALQSPRSVLDELVMVDRDLALHVENLIDWNAPKSPEALRLARHIKRKAGRRRVVAKAGRVVDRILRR